jgi:hypothetical protein
MSTERRIQPQFGGGITGGIVKDRKIFPIYNQMVMA